MIVFIQASLFKSKFYNASNMPWPQQLIYKRFKHSPEHIVLKARDCTLKKRPMSKSLLWENSVKRRLRSTLLSRSDDSVCSSKAFIFRATSFRRSGERRVE